jgi:predicted AlkP superfamily pyrophosphatase or phosphodiesterase
MKKLLGSVLAFFVWFGALPQPDRAAQRSRPPVVLISIDGLKPDYVIQAGKHGLKIPHLRRFMAEGAHATGVRGVLPTVTYPSHTTMVTGVSPARHGILANTPFDPTGKNQGRWYWYSGDIMVPALWDVLAKTGVTTAAVDWPVSVGANITYNIVQYWRAETADDLKIIRALSTPGLFDEAQRAIGSYPRGNDYSVAADKRRAEFNAFVIEKKRPAFHLCYFSGLDSEQHSSGPYSAAAFAALEEIDALVGRVRAAAERAGGGRAIVCVVSDHGFVRTDKEIHLNSALREAGLIELDDRGRVKSWKAYAWYSGGAAAVMLHDPSDADARTKAGGVLKRLAANPDSGIRVVLAGASQVAGSGGFPEAEFIVGLNAGFRLGTRLDGPVVVAAKPGGTHGYVPEMSEMDASFFIAGPGIPAGKSVGAIDMRDIAPTLAGLLGVRLPEAEGRDVLKGLP